VGTAAAAAPAVSTAVSPEVASTPARSTPNPERLRPTPSVHVLVVTSRICLVMGFSPS
jgi:hypothetical protein